MRLKAEGGLSLEQNPERCLLIVDDEELIRELCAKALKGYRVLQAEDGEEALQLIDQEPIDLVLTDVMMPRMGGLELLKAIKEQEPNQAVVVMTGYADKEIVLRALKDDADDFISKPINLLQLKTTIDKVLEKKRLKEELVRLKSIDRLKTDFLGLISHKLRTPTTAISLFIQNLASGAVHSDDPDFRQTLDLILAEAKYLGYLIQDLLFYSDVILQGGPPAPGPVDLHDLAAASLGEVRAIAAGKGIELESLLPKELFHPGLDRLQIAFVLKALLDNAIKFTPSGGKVALAAEMNGKSLRLTVKDTGIGIAREDLPKVFEKFFQVDPARTGQIRGFGLGLFYCRQFVQLHGGKITLESEPGVGTTATVILPRQ